MFDRCCRIVWGVSFIFQVFWILARKFSKMKMFFLKSINQALDREKPSRVLQKVLQKKTAACFGKKHPSELLSWILFSVSSVQRSQEKRILSFNKKTVVKSFWQILWQILCLCRGGGGLVGNWRVQINVLRRISVFQFFKPVHLPYMIFM